VSRVDRDGEATAVDFDQDGQQLRLGPRARHAPGTRVAVYRVVLEPLPAPPVELFPVAPPAPIELATVLAGASAGQIVQLGDGTYIGPARIPDGVTVRGLGPGRTVVDGFESAAVGLGRNSRLEHCTVRGGGNRIAWLPKTVLLMNGVGGVALGCRIDGHVEIAAADCRIVSCTVTGVLARGVDHVSVLRSTLTGMQWDCAIDLDGGTGHVVESCDIHDVLEGVRLTRTIDAEVRGNRIRARWWGVRAVDSEASEIAANAFDHTMRAVDVDGGTLAEITGNAVRDGDSGCIVQRGASATVVAGNHWERTRIGLLAWDAGDVRHRDNAAVDLAEQDRAVTIGP
jgi:alpha-L-fucosidase